MDNLFNVNQLAYILKVHPLTVRRYIRERKLKAVKVGGSVRIQELEVQKFTKRFIPRQRIVKQQPITKVQPEKTFNVEDPIMRLEGRGASINVPNR